MNTNLSGLGLNLSEPAPCRLMGFELSCSAVRLAIKDDVVRNMFCTRSKPVAEWCYCKTKVLEKR